MRRGTRGRPASGGPAVLIRNVDVEGYGRVDVRVAEGRVVEVGPGLGGRTGVDGHGGTLLPGLHDHHLHLTALAAEAASVRVGPADVNGADELAKALTGGAPGEWVRAVGYHESVAGKLDRAALDRLVADRSVRVQHRSGELWVWNGAALRAAGMDDAGDGRFWRSDERLRGRVPSTPLDLTGVGRRAAARGITGFTNADPHPDPDLHTILRPLPQRLTVLGLDPAAPVKIRLDDLTLPTPDELAERVARTRPRPVAVHCVTRVQLLVTLLALDTAGAVTGDRVEHGAVIPAETVEWVRRLGVTVVTQPHFPVERAAAYETDVHPEDRGHLYRCGTLRAAGVRIAAGTDAPYATADPWAVMRAAVGREGPEALPPRAALGLFMGAPLAPGGPPRAVAPGARADLCLLHVPLREALRGLSADCVRAAFVDGRPITG
ncbi:amidohydrolase family protein [Streptomyces sp. NBC_01016]|uniref:amidohydrolase family protein n=1 Tax=Streptomyces sp. NBC_01016 TaxID=2903720 RepID=UPI00225AD668|nr:amidohydrolase family protein [Streptomyces sp. NBC_01016]MCX4831353.1 amidohydrolase family protein [Streptomyces sp. NBC_01016]